VKTPLGAQESSHCTICKSLIRLKFAVINIFCLARHKNTTLTVDLNQPTHQFYTPLLSGNVRAGKSHTHTLTHTHDKTITKKKGRITD